MNKKQEISHHSSFLIPNSSRGFTLLEILLSVAMIAGLAGLSIPVYRTMISKNDLDIAVNTTASSFRRAQLLPQAVDGDTTWGVKIQNGSITIFKGASFAVRDTAFDERFDIPATISVSGADEIVFTKFTGFPQSAGAVTLTTENDTRTVTVNEKGMVNY